LNHGSSSRAAADRSRPPRTRRHRRRSVAARRSRDRGRLPPRVQRGQRRLRAEQPVRLIEGRTAQAGRAEPGARRVRVQIRRHRQPADRRRERGGREAHVGVRRDRGAPRADERRCGRRRPERRSAPRRTRRRRRTEPARGARDAARRVEQVDAVAVELERDGVGTEGGGAAHDPRVTGKHDAIGLEIDVAASARARVPSARVSVAWSRATSASVSEKKTTEPPSSDTEARANAAPGNRTAQAAKTRLAGAARTISRRAVGNAGGRGVGKPPGGVTFGPGRSRPAGTGSD